MLTQETDSVVRPRPSGRAKLALVVIVIVAALRVVSTWPVFSQTYDEGAHIAAGMEWLDRGTYTGEPQHPPLARIAAAAGPYLAGARLPDRLTLPQQGNEILHSGPYVRMLSLARAGILPFFMFSVVIVWLYAFRLAGDAAATLAAALYSNLPPVLAHAGLATTDMAVTAGIVWSLYMLHSWLDEPSRMRAVLLGIALATAFVSKFSAGLFIAAGGLATIACVLISRRGKSRYPVRRILGHALIAMVVFSFATLAVYRFNVQPLEGANREFVHGLLQETSIYPTLRPMLERVPLPAPEVAGGLAQMLLHNRSGHASYIFGEHRMGGWWYYFPVAIAVKTTLVFIILCAVAVAIFLRSSERAKSFRQLAPALSALAIVAVCLPVDINIGIRHVLPIYPLLAVTAGAGTAVLWSRGKRLRLVLIALLVLELSASLLAHPDYLPYFNPIAGPEPHRILLDSNLDWGQDLLRLSKRSRELQIEAMRLSYFGTADLSKHDLPALLEVTYDKPSPGWFAVSEGNIGSTTYPVTFQWLDRYEPVERIGRSIRLYRIPGGPKDAPGKTADLEPILVPLRLGSTPGAGRTWIAALELDNSSDKPVTVTDGGGHSLRIGPRSKATWDGPGESNAPLLYVSVEDANAISGVVTVASSADGRPAVRELSVPITAASSLSPGPLRMTIPAGCAECRRMLRIFDLSAGSPSVTVILRKQQLSERIERTVILMRSDASGRDAASAQLAIETAFPELAAGAEAEIIIRSDGGHSRQLWAYVTVTSPTDTDLVLPSR